MGKFDGVLLASDFDNTLLNTETARRRGAEVPEVSRRNREALEYFMAGGGRFAIATGRALAAFIKFADQVPMNAPGIVCNGAALYDFQKGEYLETILLDESTRRRGQETLDRFPTLAVEAYHIDNVIHAVRPNLYTRQHEHVTHVSVVEKPSLLDVPLPLGKIMFEEDHAVLEEVKAFLQSQPWAGEYEIFFSDRTLLEVTARGATKGGMVARLAERGLLRGAPDTADRRVVHLALTEQGMALSRAGQRIQSRCLEALLSGLTHAEAEQFQSLLEKVLTHAEAQLREGGRA